AQVITTRGQTEDPVFAEIIGARASERHELLSALVIAISQRLYLHVGHGFAILIEYTPCDHRLRCQPKHDILQVLFWVERKSRAWTHGSARAVFCIDKPGPIH